jgi:hypothetical protein
MSGFDDVNFTTTAATLTAAYTVTANDYVIFYDPTNAYVITLPAASAALKGRNYIFIQTVSNAGQMTLKTAGGTINNTAGGTGIAVTASKVGQFDVYCDGTNWFGGNSTAGLL